jgi:hypothetical protein
MGDEKETATLTFETSYTAHGFQVEVELTGM